MPLDLSKDIVIRWENPEPSLAGLPEQTGIKAIGEAELQTLDLSPQRGGLWPGIRRPPTVDGRGDETASASREPWVDANGYQVGYARALHPDRPAVLHYLPDKLDDRAVPFDSLELALIEAWCAGGNYILSLERDYREALRRRDPKALEAWRQLGRTAKWLQEKITLFRQPATPTVTAVLDDGAAQLNSNLLYRRNVSPALVPVTALPSPSQGKRIALVAANLRPPRPQVKQMLAHAKRRHLIAASPASQQWWRVSTLKSIRREKDREFFVLGKGQVVAYGRPIADPSEFALDVIDIITHKQRSVRLWNAPAVIALATASPQSGEKLMHLINYGSPIDIDIQARVQGQFSKARLIRPDADPLMLETAKRGTMTEVQVPELRRLGVVKFS
ncbi:MAG: hypothetical protein WKF37_25045 [Bryobacteraceae bacterium]